MQGDFGDTLGVARSSIGTSNEFGTCIITVLNNDFPTSYETPKRPRLVPSSATHLHICKHGVLQALQTPHRRPHCASRRDPARGRDVRS